MTASCESTQFAIAMAPAAELDERNGKAANSAVINSTQRMAPAVALNRMACVVVIVTFQPLRLTVHFMCNTSLIHDRS